MSAKRMTGVILLVLLLTQQGLLAAEIASATVDNEHTSPTPPLRSRAELDAWLASSTGRKTPLDALPPLARQRFLDGLVFGSRGLGGYQFAELANELTPRQARAILGLFGLESDAETLDARFTDDVPPPASPQPSTIERSFDALYRRMQGKNPPDAASEPQYADDFAQLFDDGRLRALSLRDLVHVLRAADLMAGTSLKPLYFGHVAAAVQELERRDAATAADIRDAYDGLLVTHRFEQAREYARQHPQAGLPLLPSLHDAIRSGSNAMTLWRFDASDGSLTRSELDLSSPRILIMAGCHFSEDAAEAIAEDPILGPLFAMHAQWLFLPPGQEDLDAARAWNQRFPQAPVGLLYARSEWPILPQPWAMPTFLFVRDGKVVESLTGWPRDSTKQRQPLIDAARRLGLIDD